MHKIPYSNCANLIWALILVLLLSQASYADNPDKMLPTIQTKLSTNFDAGYVELSVENTSKRLIQVSPQLQDKIPPSGSTPGCVYVSIVFERTPNVSIDYSQQDMESMISENRNEPTPIEIGPSETKIFKFKLPSFYIKLAKSSTSFKVVITCDKTSIQTLSFNHNGDEWKLQ